MKIVFLFLSIFLIVAVAVLFFPVRAKGVLHANILRREAFLSVKILFTTMSAKIYLLRNNEWSVIHNADYLAKMDSDKIDGVTFAKEMLARLKINKLDFIVDGGTKDDAYLTAMAISSLDALVTTMVSVFKPKIKNARIKIKPSYQSSEFIVSARLNIGVRVLDGIVAYIKARRVKQKGEQNA